MLICPCCGKMLKQHIKYNMGTPVVWYDCICGYTSESGTVYSDKTDFDKHFVSDTKTNYGTKQTI